MLNSASSSPSRPGLLNASDPGYPWLADSWPATSLPVNSSSGGPNDLSNFGRGGELPPTPNTPPAISQTYPPLSFMYIFAYPAQRLGCVLMCPVSGEPEHKLAGASAVVGAE